MTRARLPILNSTLLLVLLLGGCDGGPTVPSASHGLELTVYVAPPHIGGFDPVFTSELLNTSDEAITVVFPNSCTVRGYIDSARGRNVYPGWSGCYEIVSPVALAPGAVISRGVVLRPGETVAITDGQVTLPPGRYVAYAEIDGSIGDLGGEGVRLRARSVKFRIPYP
jgi:hypothetical protein